MVENIIAKRKNSICNDGISPHDDEYEWVDLNTPFWGFEKPPRETLREFDKYWRQYWKEREKQYTDMDKAFYAVEEDGQEYFYIGKTRIKITEHFPEKGRTMGELIEDLILYAARQDERAENATYMDSTL